MKAVDNSVPLLESKVKTQNKFFKIINSNYFGLGIYFALVIGCYFFAFTTNALKGNFTLKYDLPQKNYIHSFYGTLLFIGVVGLLSQFKWFYYLLRKNVWSNKFYMRWMPNTWIDLLFSGAFLFVNIYWLYYIISGFKAWAAGPYISICLLCAPYLNLLWSLAMLLCTRNSIWSSVLHMPHVYELMFHRFIGYTAYGVTLLHCFAIYIKWIIDNNWKYFLNFHATWKDFDWGVTTQLLIYLTPLILLVFITSFSFVRRTCWEAFYIPHGPIAIIIVILTIVHSSQSYRYLSIGIILYAYDRLKRHYMRNLVRFNIHSIEADHGIIRLDITPKGPCYTSLPIPGQYMFLNIPAVSWYQFHPFTVARVEDNHIIFHIKPMRGPKSWTNRLYSSIENKKVTNTTSIYVEGNYGETYDINNEKHLVYIGAGVGFAGLSNHLLYTIERYNNGELPKLETIDVFLTLIDDEHLYWYPKELEIIKNCSIVNLQVNITFSQHPEKKSNIYNDKNEGLFTIKNDIEESISIPFTVGRQDPTIMFNHYNKNERYIVFLCAPQKFINSINKYIFTNLKKSSIYADPFDM